MVTLVIVALETLRRDGVVIEQTAGVSPSFPFESED